MIIYLHWREHVLSVEAEVGPAIPALLTGHPDTWRPASGGEVKVKAVSMVRGSRERPLPDCMLEALAEDEKFLREVFEVIE